MYNFDVKIRHHIEEAHMEKTVSLTVRIPQSLHKRIKEFSKKENKSINELIRELTKNWLREKEKELLFSAFSMLGEEDVEYASMAQKEVIFADEKPKEI
jgi:predicted CopG family antitoxin